MSQPFISIALCTYNGGKFLKEQLQSIHNQSIIPDEVVISDDGSTDNTFEIIEEFTSKLNIKLYKNSPALRTVKNFERAASLCTGDIIFFCDQDDFWQSNKIETIVNFFQAKPSQEVVFSNALLVNDKLESLDTLLWHKVRLRKEHITAWQNGKSFDVLLQGNRVTGCTMAVRKVFLQKSMPFPTHIGTDFIHDGWISLLASITNQISMIDENLVWYRQHAAQQVGVIQKSAKKVHFLSRFSRPHLEKLQPFRNQASYFQRILDYILQNYPELSSKTEDLQSIVAHYQLRGNLPDSRLSRIVPVLKNAFKGNYHRYQDFDSKWYGSFLAILGDLVE